MMEAPPFLLFVLRQNVLKTASYLGISLFCRHRPQIQLSWSQGTETFGTIRAHRCWVLTHWFDEHDLMLHSPLEPELDYSVAGSSHDDPQPPEQSPGPL